MSDPRPSTAARNASGSGPCRVAVIWIDWYAYHVARFRGLLETPGLSGRVAGIELVGGVGVHAGLKFREPLPADIPVTTLLEHTNWRDAGKLRLSRELWQALTALDPDVVLVPGYYTLPGLAAALWARLYGRTSVLMTESTEADHPRTGSREFVKSLLLHALFDWAVVGGTAHRRYLARLGFAPDRVASFYDVVDNAAIARATDSFRARRDTPAADRPYFLYVGRLAREKNLGALVDAWLAYRRSGGDWPLVLAGDGPDRATLEQQLAGSPFASQVTFTGLRTSGELAPLYAGAGCFVLPSTREPWGLVVNEAMAASLPVLVSRLCGCTPDLVRDGENGFSFDPDPHAPGVTPAETLAGRLAQIASMPESSRQRMGERSRARIRPYSPEGFGREIARIVSTSLAYASSGS